MNIPTRREATDHGAYRWVAECPARNCSVEKYSDSRSKAQGKMLSHVRSRHPELMRNG